ncbi:hypothetical protein [Paraburkholderia sp.]|uniref:hypothetical protein n=1 Tax=Paraburkholderia sp. TaxID=1926495 RepID=UPI0025FAFEDD|nr:hypothetical protein [Paraburkholderia sp.]
MLIIELPARNALTCIKQAGLRRGDARHDGSDTRANTPPTGLRSLSASLRRWQHKLDDLAVNPVLAHRSMLLREPIEALLHGHTHGIVRGLR